MKILGALLLSLATFLSLSLPVSADVNNFVINNFNADYTLTNGVPGGKLEVIETIDLTYSAQNHGIFRYVPKSYRGYDTKLEVKTVQKNNFPEPFEVYGESGNTVIKIGDPNKTVTGPQSYRLEYTMQRVVNFEGGGQEFYWDVTGNGWGQTIEKASASLRVLGADMTTATLACYSGVQGAAGKDCTAVNENGVIKFATTLPLSPSEGLTVASSLPGITFTQPTFRDVVKDHIVNLMGVLLGIIGAIWIFIFWLKNGKDYKRRGTIIPLYEPPEKLTPAEVGLLMDYSADNKDISATIIDLAVRKFVRLHEKEKKILFFKNRSYSIELLNVDTNQLKPHERTLLEAIFPTFASGELVEMNDLNKATMSVAVKRAKDQIRSSITELYHLIEPKSDRLSGYLIAGGFVTIIGAIILSFLGWGFVLGAAIFGAAALLFGYLMPRRSLRGNEVLDQIYGLKMYMDVAEKDRLKMMQSVERPYAEPEKTVNLFEKLLPYAVALGVEKSWAKQFDGILTEQPDWIRSNHAAFTGAYLASSISSMTGSFSSNFQTSSGSSGGGSSGGGGGGGGGGGW